MRVFLYEEMPPDFYPPGLFLCAEIDRSSDVKENIANRGSNRYIANIHKRYIPCLLCDPLILWAIMSV